MFPAKPEASPRDGPAGTSLQEWGQDAETPREWDQERDVRHQPPGWGQEAETPSERDQERDLGHQRPGWGQEVQTLCKWDHNPDHLFLLQFSLVL